MRVKLIQSEPSPAKTMPQESESGLGTIGRNIVRSGVTAAESILGLPGDIAASANMLAQKLPQPQQRKAGDFNALLGEAIPQITKGISNILPTQESLHRNITQKHIAPHLPKDYLEPQNYAEQFGNELVSLIAPGGLGVKTAAGAGKLLASGVSGLTAKETARAFGVGPFGQAVAQFGGAILPGMWGNAAKVTQQVEKDYLAAEKAAANKFIKGQPLYENNEKFLKKVTTGQPLPYKKEVSDQLIPLKELFQGTDRRIPVNEAVSRVQEFNKLAYDTRNYSKEARDIFKKTAEALDDSIMNYGKQHPAFGNPYSLAKSGYRGLHERSNIENFFKDNIDLTRFQSPLTKIAFGTLGTGGSYLAKGAAGLGITGASVGGLYSIRELDNLRRLLTRSATARKIYADSIKNAASANKAALIKNVNNFEKIAQHFDKAENPKSMRVRVRLVK